MHPGQFLIIARKGVVDRGTDHRAEQRCRLRGQLLPHRHRQAGRHLADEALHRLPGDREPRGQKAQIGRVILGQGAAGRKDAQAFQTHLLAVGVEPVFHRDVQHGAQQQRDGHGQFDHGAREAADTPHRAADGRGQAVEPVPPVAHHPARPRRHPERPVQRGARQSVHPVAHETGQPLDQAFGAVADDGHKLHAQPARIQIAPGQTVDLGVHRRVIDRRKHQLRWGGHRYPRMGDRP